MISSKESLAKLQLQCRTHRCTFFLKHVAEAHIKWQHECIQTCSILSDYSVRTVRLTASAWLMSPPQRPQELKFKKTSRSPSSTDKDYFPSLSSPRSFFLIQLHVSQPVFFTLGEAKTSHRNLSKSQRSPRSMCGPPQLWRLQRQQWLAGHNNDWWELEGRGGREWEQQSMNGKMKERNIFCLLLYSFRFLLL